MMGPLDRLINRHPEGVCLLSSTGRIMLVNEALGRTLGAAHTLVDTSLLDDEHPLGFLRGAFAEARAAGKPWAWKAAAAGTLLSGWFVPLSDDEWACTCREVAEHERLQHSLDQSQRLLRTIIDEFPDPLVIKDRDGNFLLGNRTVARLYGTTPEALVGKHDGDFGVPKAMADFFRENVRAIMARGETEVVFEDSRDAITGEIRHYRSIKRPLTNAAGEREILVIAQDITDVVRSQTRVAESEQRLQHVLRITHEGVWDWHVPSGRVVHNASGTPCWECPRRTSSGPSRPSRR